MKPYAAPVTSSAKPSLRTTTSASCSGTRRSSPCRADADGRAALRLLRGVTHASGGNDLIGPLERCHEILNRFTGDRVVALFGDGDLTPRDRVLVKVAEMKSENIRFVTRGLGVLAAREFGEISDEEAAAAAVNRVEDLAAGIAGMAASLKPRTGPPPSTGH